MKILLTLIFLFVFSHLHNKPIQSIQSFDFFRHKECLVDAFMYVESRYNEKIIGNGNDAGVLQLRPIMVREANRILKQKKYTYSDRFSFENSINIFEIIMAHYNSGYKIERACKLWNPTASKKYFDKIYKKYLENYYI